MSIKDGNFASTLEIYCVTRLLTYLLTCLPITLSGIFFIFFAAVLSSI